MGCAAAVATAAKETHCYIYYQLYFVIVKDYNEFGHLLTSQVCYLLCC